MSSIAEPASPASEPGDGELLFQIRAIKERLGSGLILLTHHYQRAEIVALGDRVGDSYELARAARDAVGARWIVFCGVRFMAEAAEVLRRPEQVVLHPDPAAGCPMADMTTTEQARQAWEALRRARGEDQLTPLVYMNSSAALKAQVGRWGGSVCTSSNAGRAFAWALRQRPAVLFMPDEHLGRNTARAAGISAEETVLYDPALPEGGLSSGQITRARVILWKGYCHVHTAFTVEDVQRARRSRPGCRVLVHPECIEAVVQAADGAGSTSYLVKAVAEARPGSILVIGTEVNLVSRLAAQHPDRTVVPLRRSLCPNMFRIGPGKLLQSLQSVPDRMEPVSLSEDLKTDARVALERMLSL